MKLVKGVDEAATFSRAAGHFRPGRQNLQPVDQVVEVVFQ
jgi:hypothetical protein